MIDKSFHNIPVQVSYVYVCAHVCAWMPPVCPLFQPPYYSENELGPKYKIVTPLFKILQCIHTTCLNLIKY